MPAAPLPSLLRNFSAPVIVEYDYSDDELAFLLAHDSDPFNRWEAGQRLATRALLTLAEQAAAGAELALGDAFVEAFRRVLSDDTLSPAFRELALTLPSEAYLADQMREANPAAVHRARQFVRARLAQALRAEWLAIHERHRTPGAYAPTPEDAGHRALKNLALVYLAELPEPAEAVRLATAQYEGANNMTDRAAALGALLSASAGSAAAEAPARQALADFYQRFEKEALVIDKWFSMQATRRGTAAASDAGHGTRAARASGLQPEEPEPRALADLQLLRGQPGAIPRRRRLGLRVLGRPGARARRAQPAGGRAPRAFARTVRRFTPALRERMRGALERVAAGAKSRDVREIVEKALA